MNLEQWIDEVNYADACGRANADITVTNGIFDLVHPGHCYLLHQICKDHPPPTYHLLLLNSDASARALKGPGRPLFELEHRQHLLAHLASTEAIVVFDGRTPTEELVLICQAFGRRVTLIKGDTYSVDEIVGHEVVEAAGGRVYRAHTWPRYSTSQIAGEIRQKLAE